MNTVGWIVLAVGVIALIVLGQVLAAFFDRSRSRRMQEDLPERTHGIVDETDVARHRLADEQ